MRGKKKKHCNQVHQIFFLLGGKKESGKDQLLSKFKIMNHHSFAVHCKEENCTKATALRILLGSKKKAGIGETAITIH